jgi:hypothetical protein
VILPSVSLIVIVRIDSKKANLIEAIRCFTLTLSDNEGETSIKKNLQAKIGTTRMMTVKRVVNQKEASFIA